MIWLPSEKKLALPRSLRRKQRGFLLSPARFGSGPPPYTTTASDYGSDYATRGADLTGITDGKEFIFSCWLRLGSTSQQTIFTTGSALRFLVQVSSGGVIAISAANAANTTILSVSTGAFALSTATWYHILISGDMAQSNSTKIYIADTARTSITTHTNDTIDFTNGNYGIGGRVNGTTLLSGCLSEIFFHRSYLDISVQANRRLFISAAGKPVSLGANGSTPLGVQPLVYVPNGNPSTNAGTGGNFTITGSLGACASSPSD